MSSQITAFMSNFAGFHREITFKFLSLLITCDCLLILIMFILMLNRIYLLSVDVIYLSVYMNFLVGLVAIEFLVLKYFKRQ